MTNSKRLTRTTMGSALERHTAGREALAVQETARELAAASVSASTRRAYEGALRRLQDWLDGRILDDAPLPNTWPPASRRSTPRPWPARLSSPSGSTRSSGASRPPVAKGFQAPLAP